jgi:hypothetical protein
MEAANAMQARIETRRPPTIASAADSGERLKTERIIVPPKSAESAKVSPWAKLMSWRIP